jgi:hypothetical protein
LPDILSQGEGRASGPWPRRLAAVAVLALVAVLIVHYLPRSKHVTARPAVTAAPLLSAASLPSAVSRAVSGDAGVAAEPDGITGQILSWPGGLRLPVTGERPAWFSPATGQVLPIGGLPSQRSGYQFIRLAGGWAVQASPVAEAACGSCAGPQRAVYFLADSGRSATPAGVADAVAPGVPGTLWLTSYPSDADPFTAPGVAREVSVAGHLLGPQVTLPAGYVIEQGTSRGLLLTPAAPRTGGMPDRLWDPATRQVSRSFDTVIAASATQIAWAPCAARCRMQVLNLATGRQASAELPAASSVASASFSPDGSFLVIQVGFSDNTANGARAVQLERMSLTSGRLTVVPHTWVSSDALIGFGWPASSDSLVAEFSFTTKTQLASWRPGADRLAVAALKPQPSLGALVIGQHSA